jgi:hypothetical protein
MASELDQIKEDVALLKKIVITGNGNRPLRIEVEDLRELALSIKRLLWATFLAFLSVAMPTFLIMSWKIVQLVVGE